MKQATFVFTPQNKWLQSEQAEVLQGIGWVLAHVGRQYQTHAAGPLLQPTAALLLASTSTRGGGSIAASNSDGRELRYHIVPSAEATTEGAMCLCSVCIRGE
jgi:hypothetical protein